jgi:hypothetical protein
MQINARGGLAVAGAAAAVLTVMSFQDVRWVREFLESKLLRGGGETRSEEIERRLCAVEIHLQNLPPERVS